MDPFAQAAQALSRPGVGSAQVDPRYVGSAQVDPRYVGAPAVMNAGGPQPIGYGPVQYTAGDVSMFGMGTFTVPAGATAFQTGKLTPVNPITPQRLGCPSNVQGLLLIAAVIGSTNLLNGMLGIPIEFFSEVSTFPQILWPTIETSTGIEFTVANPTGGPLSFKPTFYGTQVRR